MNIDSCGCHTFQIIYGIVLRPENISLMTDCRTYLGKYFSLSEADRMGKADTDCEEGNEGHELSILACNSRYLR